jgi:hypothetical protein
MASSSSLNEQLVKAAVAGQSARCIELIESKACIDDTSKGWTALIKAIHYKHEDTAMLLIHAKANVRIAGRHCSWTALHKAAARGYVPICSALLQRGADPNAVCIERYTPLSLAAAWWKPAVCTMLLNAGASPDFKNSRGLTALEDARVRGATTCVDAIRAWMKDRDAAAAFARGTMHARRTHKQGVWTDSMLCDKHIVAEITACVTPRAPPPPPPLPTKQTTATEKTKENAAESKQAAAQQAIATTATKISGDSK